MQQQLRRRLRTALLSIDGVLESPGIFGEGDAFWVNGKQIGHFREEDVLDLRLTRGAISAQRSRLKTDPRVELRPSSSDWLKLHFSSNADLTFVLELAEQAAQAHRAPPGVPSRPPPMGGDLERRRRFH
jgi:hypothetical protein